MKPGDQVKVRRTGERGKVIDVDGESILVRHRCTIGPDGIRAVDSIYLPSELAKTRATNSQLSGKTG